MDSSCFDRLNWSSFDRLRVKGGGFDSGSKVGAVVIIAGAGETQKLVSSCHTLSQQSNDAKYTYWEEQLELAAQPHADS